MALCLLWQPHDCHKDTASADRSCYHAATLGLTHLDEPRLQQITLKLPDLHQIQPYTGHHYVGGSMQQQHHASLTITHLVCRLQGNRPERTGECKEGDQAAAPTTHLGTAHVPLHIRQSGPHKAAQADAILTQAQVDALEESCVQLLALFSCAIFCTACCHFCSSNSSSGGFTLHLESCVQWEGGGGTWVSMGIILDCFSPIVLMYFCAVCCCFSSSCAVQLQSLTKILGLLLGMPHILTPFMNMLQDTAKPSGR